MSSSVMNQDTARMFSRIPLIWETFLYIYLIFYFVPSILLYYSINDVSLLTYGVSLYLSGFIVESGDGDRFLLASFIFLIGYLLPLIYWRLTSVLPVFRSKRFKLRALEKNAFFRDSPVLNLFQSIVYLSAILGFSIVILYLFFFGLDYLYLLGSETSREDFRQFLYSEEYKIYNLALEIARRILLPISVSYLIFLSYIKEGRLSLGTQLLWVILLLAGIITLDRAPIFTALALIIIYSVFKSSSLTRGFVKVLSWLIVLLIVGGVATQLQYNETELPFDLIFSQGVAVLINGLFFDPALMSLTHSFLVVDGNTNPLLLAYSRISVLWGNSYVGTFSEFSMFVTPVSIVGDIWRNFGMTGIFFFSFIFSYMLLFISKFQAKTIIFFKFPIFFLSVIFSFYAVKGTIFSLGPIFILLMIFILCLLGTYDERKIKHI